MTEVAGGVAVLSLTAPVGAVSSTPNVNGPVAMVTLSAPVGEVGVLVIVRTNADLMLALVDTDVPLQPGVLRVTVTNGADNAAVFFFLDGAAAAFASTTLSSTGAADSPLPINGRTVGTHEVRVSGTNVLPALTAANSKTFTISGAPAPAPVVFSYTPPAVVVNVDRWFFQAYDGSSSYVFPRNPDRSTRTYGDFTFTAEPTVVSNGLVVEWEGATKPPPWAFVGRVFTQAEHDALVSWCTRGRVYLTDHFGRRFLVQPQLTTTRVRDRERPWHHTYQATCDVLAGTGVVTV